jgi:hypothetical protein
VTILQKFMLVKEVVLKVQDLMLEKMLKQEFLKQLKKEEKMVVVNLQLAL